MRIYEFFWQIFQRKIMNRGIRNSFYWALYVDHCEKLLHACFGLTLNNRCLITQRNVDIILIEFLLQRLCNWINFLNAIPLMTLLNKNRKVDRILQEFKISPLNHTFLKSGGSGLHDDTHFSYKNKEIFFCQKKNTIFLHLKITFMTMLFINLYWLIDIAPYK